MTDAEKLQNLDVFVKMCRKQRETVSEESVSAIWLDWILEHLG